MEAFWGLQSCDPASFWRFLPKRRRKVWIRRGAACESELPLLHKSRGYPTKLLTAEKSNSNAATGTITRRRKQNLLPHRATISTEIGESLRECIAIPPKKAKALPLQPAGLFAYWPRQLHAVMTAIAANSFRPIPRNTTWRKARPRPPHLQGAF